MARYTVTPLCHPRHRHLQSSSHLPQLRPHASQTFFKAPYSLLSPSRPRLLETSIPLPGSGSGQLLGPPCERNQRSVCFGAWLTPLGIASLPSPTRQCVPVVSGGHGMFIRSSADTRLGCFPCFGYCDQCRRKHGCENSFQTLLSLLLGANFKAELLDHRIIPL